MGTEAALSPLNLFARSQPRCLQTSRCKITCQRKSSPRNQSALTCVVSRLISLLVLAACRSGDKRRQPQSSREVKVGEAEPPVPTLKGTHPPFLPLSLRPQNEVEFRTDEPADNGFHASIVLCRRASTGASRATSARPARDDWLVLETGGHRDVRVRPPPAHPHLTQTPHM